MKDTSERWLLTYADMITLLMLFFIILYTLSTQDVRRYAVIARSLNQAFAVDVRTADLSKVDAPSAGEELLQQLKIQSSGSLQDRQLASIVDQIAVQSGTYDDIHTQFTNEGVTISVLNALLFHSGRADLRPEAKQSLGAVAKLLSDLPYPVRVEGHTDDLPPTGSIYHDNLELSVARGYAVAEFLNGAGIASSRIAAAGYGDARPKAPNSTPANRALNRRIDIVVVTREGTHESIPSRP